MLYVPLVLFGGVNHFIIHSGSKYLGKQVAEYCLNKAYCNLTNYSQKKWINFIFNKILFKFGFTQNI